MNKNRQHQSEKRTRFFLLPLSGLFILLICAAAHPQNPSAYQQESDAQISQLFSNIAYEIANSSDVNSAKAEQAIVFFKAARDLGKISSYALPCLFKVARQYAQQDHSSLISELLFENLDYRTETEVIRDTVSYLLNKTNNREEREQMLVSLMQSAQGKNSYFDSEILTSLALLRIEVSDANAIGLFIRAYNDNKLNRTALEKLTELVPDAINPLGMMEHLRLIMGENPLDLDNALSFAESARLLELYQTSSDAYQYCSDLYNYLYPSRPLPAYVYLPWALSAYNSERSIYKCEQLAKNLQQIGQFDFLLEAIAAKAAIKTGDAEKGKKLFESAEKKAKSNYFAVKETEGDFTKAKFSRELAWFYCFVKPDPNQSLIWAKEADKLEPNSPIISSYLAYSLLINNQQQAAKALAEKFPDNQVAELVKARIQLAENQKDTVITTLKSCISKDPGSFEAEIAKQLMAENGETYLPALDNETIVDALQTTLNRPLVPVFTTPDKILKAELNLRGTRFAYGKDFGASIIIKNNSAEPLVISDNSFFSGNIRIDAAIKGDIEKNIPNLIVMKYQPTVPIEPGKSIVIPLNLFTGQLRQILIRHPQASVGVEFTLYLDPVITDGKVPINKLADIKPIVYRISRQPVKISAMVIRREIESLASGQEGQKVTTATLLAGLLAEQNDIAKGRVFYQSSYEDWMTNAIRSALVKVLRTDEWTTKTLVTGIMTDFSPDERMQKAISENLSDSHWPCRLTALYVLAKNNLRFSNVLEWTAKFDTNKTVREMAVSFGATAYEPEPLKTQTAVPDSNKIAVPDSNKIAVPDSNKITLPGTDKITLPDANKTTVPDSSKITPPAINKPAVPDANKTDPNKLAPFTKPAATIQ